jgi:4-hydroxybenzoate polyprenyltransferase
LARLRFRRLRRDFTTFFKVSFQTIQFRRGASVQPSSSEAERPPSSSRPLVVDLDHGLVRSDLLQESICAGLGRCTADLGSTLRTWRRDGRPLSRVLAGIGEIDYAALPYDEDMLARVRDAYDLGRPVYLMTTHARHHAVGVAEHLGLFENVFGATTDAPLTEAAKARMLSDAFGSDGFDYHRALSQPMRGAATAKEAVPTWRVRLSAMRPHQYVKNGLVFVPMLTAHAFDQHMLLAAMLAFLSFSACASGVCIINDLIDLAADRQHPAKRNRAFARGALPLREGLIAAPSLIFVAAVFAACISWSFTLVLLAYFIVTSLYSAVLKRKVLVDALCLAGLSTWRVVAGGVATGIEIPQWLLAFSIFLFLSLALMKIIATLAPRQDQGPDDAKKRIYGAEDLPVLAALAGASGFSAVTVFSLHLSSADIRGQYHHAQILWLACPVLIYWISRALMMANRRLMHDDPILFAVRDRVSWIAAGMLAIIFMSAS